MDLPLLNDIEVRVLGSLIEKQISTPEYYPLSLNALVNACNQTNNRNPVATYGESDVNRALVSLRDKHLACEFSGGTSRVLKFGHKLVEALELSPAEVAVLCVLMLRGPQTPGEIRGHSGRLHEFADPAHAMATLATLAGRHQPLVVCLPRQPGTKESRYCHLLAGGPSIALATPPVDPTASASAKADAEPDRLATLESEVAGLRREVTELRLIFDKFRKQFE